MPKLEMQPKPLTTTRWRMGCVRYHDPPGSSMSPITLLGHILLLLAMVAPQATPARPAGDLFAEIFQRGLVKQKTMKSIRATFTETTTSSLLVKPIVAKGTIVAAPPARVRMTYAEPEPKVIVM